MAGVDLADRGDQLLVEAHQRLGVLSAVVAGNGLVEQVVERDRRIVAVAARQLDPEGDRQLLVAPVGEEVGPAQGVVDVRARLPARRAMQVEDDVEPVLAAPLDAALDQREAVLAEAAVVVQDDPRVDRDAQRVVAARGDRGDVLLGHIGVAEAPPESGSGLVADQPRDQALDLARARALVAEQPHVALREQPVPQADAAQEDRRAALVHDVPAAACEPGERGCGHSW